MSFKLQSNNNDEGPEWRQTFSKNMYDGYALALKRQKPVSFKFRGIETTLYPDQLTVDDNLINIRIKDVQKELQKRSNVSVFYYF